MRFVTWYGDNVVALLKQPDQAKLAHGALVHIRDWWTKNDGKENQITLSGPDTHAEPTLMRLMYR